MPTLRGLEVAQGADSVPHDHQPVPRRDAAGEPAARRRAEIRPRARDSLPRQPLGPVGSGLERVSGPDAGPGPGPVGLADPGALPRLHGPVAGLDGDLPIRRRRNGRLLEIMQEIERHRGYRPKASVILLYNRVLAAACRSAVLGRPDRGDPAAVCRGNGRPDGRDRGRSIE